MSLNHSRWNLLPPAPSQYLSELRYPKLIAQLLYNRGLRDLSDIELFLAADERLAADSKLLPGIEHATSRIYRALLSGEKIAVYGDFDVDGITGAALLANGLRYLGADVTPYIPHRMTEGHGLRIAALEELQNLGVRLVVTVDCGVTDVKECQWAKNAGMDVVISDHHAPPPILPNAAAIVDPKLPESKFPYPQLAGVGVGYKLLEALFKSIGRDEILAKLTDLVAIGTIADVVPLRGENRYLVKQGLMVLNTEPRLGIREMANICGLNIGSLDTDKVTWCIAPWLNASGRLEHAMSSYRLLTTDSVEEARSLAVLLGQKNAERQKMTTELFTKIKEQIVARGLTPLLISSGKDYSLGVAGPVAGKLAEEFYRPVIVVRVDEKTSSGSCRSIPEFNMIAALNRCGHLLNRFGGHAEAAGFSLITENLPKLEECLNHIAEVDLEGVDLRPRLDIDIEVALPELGGETYKMIQKLAPFGKGNPYPTFLSRGVQVIDCRIMGNGAEHLRLKLKQRGMVWDAVAFRQGDCFRDVACSLDIVFNLEVDSWNGMESLRLNIVSFAPSTGENRFFNNPM